MRISDWSSDVCSSDLESDRFSIETTEDARRVPQDRTVTAPGRPGDPAPLPVVQYRQRPARSACNAGFGKLKARAGPVYPQKRSSMVNDGLPWTGRALLSTSELGRDGGAVRCYRLRGDSPRARKSEPTLNLFIFSACFP